MRRVRADHRKRRLRAPRTDQPRKAEYLATLPKHPVKRFAYRLHPKRFFTYWFSREGGIMALKIAGVGILLMVLMGGALFAYYRRELDAIRPSEIGVTFDEPLGDVAFPDPTQIAFDGKRLLIVADSGWATIDRPGFVRTAGAPIIAVPLGADCEVR